MADETFGKARWLAEAGLFVLVAHVMGWILGSATIMVTRDVVRLWAGSFVTRMLHHVRHLCFWSPRVVMRILIRIGRNLRHDRARQKREGDRNC